MLAPAGAAPSAVRSHEELFAYWAGLRQGDKLRGRLPGREDIDPGDFKRHLPHVSLIELRGEVRRYRMRLAGTGLYTLYGREITGCPLEEVFPGEEVRYWREQLDQVVEGCRPAVGCRSLAWRNAPHLSVLWLRLPLARDGRRVDMILGYDALIGLPPGTPSSGIRAA
jgi:hypothetical protein